MTEQEEKEKRRGEFVTACLDRLGINQDYATQHDAEIEAQEVKEAAARKQDRYEKTAPRRYWRESLETYNTTTQKQVQALAIVRRFVTATKAGKAVGLALLGAVGTGKTHLACGALKEIGGKFYNASELGERMHRAHGFSTKETEYEILDECTDCDLLVIDEIGRGANSEDEKYAIYKILNERYNAEKSTLLISNLSRVDFFNYIGAAAADRFSEVGGVFEFGNEKSYRKELRGEK